uniref:Uncharacterized protein n=1 Tax=Oryza sativa subsp. japonica TaxID=39947 RepID=Q109C1_ORYSJ|nr:hypothetical protein LOC_Os10g38954 [Oryza sativa Japonica Group]
MAPMRGGDGALGIASRHGGTAERRHRTGDWIQFGNLDVGGMWERRSRTSSMRERCAHPSCGTGAVPHPRPAGPARSRFLVPHDRLRFRSFIPSLRFVLVPAQPFRRLGIFLQINHSQVWQISI